jgi:hypothetical protein
MSEEAMDTMLAAMADVSGAPEDRVRAASHIVTAYIYFIFQKITFYTCFEQVSYIRVIRKGNMRALIPSKTISFMTVYMTA